MSLIKSGMAICCAAVAVICFANATASVAYADGIFDVTITGEVEFNQVNNGFLGNVSAGDPTTLSFQVDESVFTDSPNFPTRGYEIDQDSLTLDFNGLSIGLQDPFPGGQTLYFVLRDNDPAVDGFFVASSFDFPTGVPINQLGGFGQFFNNFSVTYSGDALTSLDIADAEGSYDFAGLTVFNWTIEDGPFSPVGIVFSELTISKAVPEPSVVVPMMWLVVLIGMRRRKSS